MKKFFLTLILTLSCAFNFVFAQDGVVLKSGVSIIENVPKSFYGTWRVSSQLVSTNDNTSFMPVSINLWNLSRRNNVINLTNPMTGASASVTLNSASYNKVVFTKITSYNNIKLTDKVELQIIQNEFKGYNELKLEKPNSDIKTAKYLIRGKKISGTTIDGD